jgi:hypothetical protein
MLTELTDEQAKYVGVKKEGPYKSDHDRYRARGGLTDDVGHESGGA